MARELILSIACDFCRASLTEEETRTGEVTLGDRNYHLDLCEQCSTDLTRKLVPKPKADTRPAERTVPCELCGVKCKNERGLKFHKFRMHPGSVEKVDPRKRHK